MIYKTPFGKHIDLSKLVSISDAYFIDRMGYGGWFVGFDMHFQLMDNPILFERELVEDKEYTFHDKHQLIQEGGQPIAVVNMQKQIDEIIKAWKECPH
jgi:hypothetical protein